MTRPARAQPAEEDEELRDAEALKTKRDAEFQRARRLRQMMKLLNSLQMRRAVEMLRRETRNVVAVAALAYLVGFIVMCIMFARTTAVVQRSA